MLIPLNVVNPTTDGPLNVEGGEAVPVVKTSGGVKLRIRIADAPAGAGADEGELSSTTRSVPADVIASVHPEAPALVCCVFESAAHYPGDAVIDCRVHCHGVG